MNCTIETIKKAVVAAGLLAIAGCTTLADVKDARGTGKTQSYAASYDTVWGAIEEVLKESSLDIVSADKAKGTILAQRGMNLANYGDNVAIFVSRSGESSTSVEVVHKRAMQTNILGAQWDKAILERLEKRLAAK